MAFFFPDEPGEGALAWEPPAGALPPVVLEEEEGPVVAGTEVPAVDAAEEGTGTDEWEGVPPAARSELPGDDG